MARLTTKSMVIAGGAALVLLAGGTAAGAAIASGPVDGSGVIHGCWTNTAINGSHAFILQDAGTACPNGIFISLTGATATPVGSVQINCSSSNPSSTVTVEDASLTGIPVTSVTQAGF